MRVILQLMEKNLLFASFDVVPAPKGASTHILQSTEALAREVAPVTLLCAGAPGYLDEEILAPGVKVVRAPLPAGANFLHRIEAYQDFVRQFLARSGGSFGFMHYRDIWSGLPILDFLDEAQGARPPLVMEVNGLPSFELGYHYPAVLQNKGFVRKLRAQECACMLAADRVLTVSPVNAVHIEGVGILRERICVVPNGVDVERFVPPRARARGEREVPQLLYVGTLAPWQGVVTLLHALKKVVRERPVEVVFAGRGRKVWLKEALKLASELKVLPYVDFRGTVSPEEVPGLVAEADLCLAPLERTRRNTRQGCCPIKILEYMACARPFVASDLPVVRALLPRDEAIEQFLVLPGKPGHLAERILGLLAEERRDEVAHAAGSLRAYVAENLTWKMTNERLVDMYRNL